MATAAAFAAMSTGAGRAGAGGDATGRGSMLEILFCASLVSEEAWEGVAGPGTAGSGAAADLLVSLGERRGVSVSALSPRVAVLRGTTDVALFVPGLYFSGADMVARTG